MNHIISFINENNQRILLINLSEVLYKILEFLSHFYDEIDNNTFIQIS